LIFQGAEHERALCDSGCWGFESPRPPHLANKFKQLGRVLDRQAANAGELLIPVVVIGKPITHAPSQCFQALAARVPASLGDARSFAFRLLWVELQSRRQLAWGPKEEKA